MKRGQNQRSEEYDDGKPVADMNVDGMPWTVRRRYRDEAPESSAEGEPLSPKQRRMYRFAALKAGLFVVLVYGLVFFLFIAFCDFIWFR